MFIGSVPPPLHGAAMCMKFVVDNQAQLPCEFLHLDTRYTASSQELGSLSVKKLWLWGKYLVQFTHSLAFKKVDGRGGFNDGIFPSICEGRLFHVVGLVVWETRDWLAA